MEVHGEWWYYNAHDQRVMEGVLWLCHALTSKIFQRFALGHKCLSPSKNKMPKGKVVLQYHGVDFDQKRGVDAGVIKCDTLGTRARQIPDLLSDISLTETSRISS